jgi:hypothetical protein
MCPKSGLFVVTQLMRAKSAKKEESKSKNGQKVGRSRDKEQQGVGSSARMDLH